MPEGSTGEKRPVEAVGNAVHVMTIATGEIEETVTPDDGKDPTAKALGKISGATRARAMTPAMAAGLMAESHDMEWLAGLVEAVAPKPGKRKTYKPRAAATSK